MCLMMKATKQNPTKQLMCLCLMMKATNRNTSKQRNVLQTELMAVGQRDLGKAISYTLARVHVPMVEGGGAKGATTSFNMMRIECSTHGEKMRNVTTAETFTIAPWSA